MKHNDDTIGEVIVEELNDTIDLNVARVTTVTASAHSTHS